MQSDTDAIIVHNLTRVFRGSGHGTPPVVANDHLGFRVRRGEIFGLLGENGAGKTTLVTQLLGLLPPTTGDILLEGIDVVREPDRIKPITGFLPQTGLPMRYVEVRRALYFTGRLRGQTDADARRQADALLEELDLTAAAGRYVNKLSGGMLRMTNFAMALMGYPRVLVLDEPTNNLDPQRRRQVWGTVARLNRERGVTCVLVTHNVLEAERVIQRVLVMQAGRIVAQGTPGELKLTAGGRVRLEFRFKDDQPLSSDEASLLARFGSPESSRTGYYSMTLPAEAVADATDAIVNGLGMARLDDFRIAPPSLEDVYLDLKDREHAG